MSEIEYLAFAFKYSSKTHEKEQRDETEWQNIANYWRLNNSYVQIH